MNVCLLTLVLLAADDPPAALPKSADALLALYRQEAQAWKMFVDDERQIEAALNAKPIYVWTNPTRSGGQNGAVFVWLHQGRPVVIASIFSHPEAAARMVCHELHSLAAEKLFPERDPTSEPWEPQEGVKMLPMPGAPAVETVAARRLIQMRALSKQFTAHSIDYQKERWELRLLPQPMYRYDKPEGPVVDGAIFAYVTSAGTDPEVVLVLEARKNGDSLAWHYRAIRFSDSDLHVQHDGKEVFSSIRDDKNQLHFNPDHTYRLIRDRSIPELPELATQTPAKAIKP
jgi:hypothetical protein